MAEFEEVRPLFPTGEREVLKYENAFNFVFYDIARQLWKAIKEISADYGGGGESAIDLHKAIPQDDLHAGIYDENAYVDTVDCALKNWRKT